MYSYRRLAALAALIAVAACTDQSDPVAPPVAEIVDGAHNDGNQHFYFLPPMVRTPFYTGTFDPMVAPEVEICEWTGSACGAVIATFTTTTGSGSEIVRMEPGEEQYIVNWHTNRFNLDAAKTYRIRVLVGTYVLGHADVDVVSTGKELRNVNTNEYIALLDDRTLPIKFRIEEGAVPVEERGVIGAGYYHTCALATGGLAYCWGYGYYGQLGQGTGASSTLPVAVAGGHVFTALTTGNYGTCGLKADGSAWCWGYGGAGGLGNGTMTYAQPTPVPVSGGHAFTTLVSGAYQTCGLKVDGSAWCWGYNAYGQLGLGFVSSYATIPQAVAGGHAYQSLGAGDYHSCGVTTSGSPLCWGYSYYGQLGNGTTYGGVVPTPVAVSGAHAFASVDAGGYHTCALEPTGEAWCWGYNSVGSVGNGTTAYMQPIPAAVVGGHQFTTLTAGEYHNCAIDAAGMTHCWGYNNYGQVGDGTTASRYQPVLVGGGNTFVALDAGQYHSCGVTSLGGARCWGLNNLGQLGNSTNVNSPLPTGVGGSLTFETP